jgi:histone deacetylase 1/2
MYAGRSHVRIMALKQRISTFTKGNQSMATYLQGIKAISDELSIIDHPLDDTDLVIHTLNGLTVEYREISAALRSRESPIAFAELHEKLMDFETIHHRADQHVDVVATANAVTRNKGQQYRNNNNRNTSPIPPNSDNRPVCQFCDKPGHSAKVCYKIRGFPKRYGTKATANIAQNQAATQNANWIMDTGASHHISQDLQQLTLANSYPGADQVTVGDGTGLKITHTGNSIIHTSVKPLHLKQVLCVPKIQSNLLSVSKLCQSNGCSVEFFPNSFVVKDLKSGQALLQGPLKQDLYHLSIAFCPSSPPQALHTSIQSASTWHHKLGHHSFKIIKHLIGSHHLPIKLPPSQECNSCYCAKSHKLPFSDHHLTSSKPLELLYSDVWGPAPVRSLDGYLYYLIIVDHFSKYVWLYPMKHKSDVFSIFVQFKSIVEKKFNLPIVSFFSDNGGEFIKLKSFLANNGISHLTTPPHTPEVNGTAERRHRHVVETGRALLHHANLPP